MIPHLPELHQAIMTFFEACLHDRKHMQIWLQQHQLHNRICYVEDGRCIFGLEGLFDAVTQFCQLDQEYSFNEFRQCLYKNPTNVLLSERGLYVDIYNDNSTNSEHCYQLFSRERTE